MKAQFATPALGLMCGLCGGVLTFATLNALHQRDLEQKKAPRVSVAAPAQAEVPKARPRTEPEPQVLEAPPADFHDNHTASTDEDDDVPPPTHRSPFEGSTTNTYATVTGESNPPPATPPAIATPPASPPPAETTSFQSATNADSIAPQPEWSSVNIDVTVEPKEGSVFKRMAERVPSLAGHLPVLGRPFRKENKELVAAHPTGGLKPQIPVGLTRTLRSPIEVDVEASIDHDGNVRNAEVTRGSATELADIVERKVRSVGWRPAHEGSRTVAMDVVIHYRFNPAKDR